jgi:hypothetical protein
MNGMNTEDAEGRFQISDLLISAGVSPDAGKLT